MRHSERKPLFTLFVSLAALAGWSLPVLADDVQLSAPAETVDGAPVEAKVSASLDAPDTAEARSIVNVTWEGPGNDLDYVAIQPAGSEPTASGPYAYTSRGPELRIEAPREPGEYEIRYLTGGSNQVLASRPLSVTPAPLPGTLRVVDAAKTPPLDAGATVTVILDASGSMLQRLDGERRIDIAKDAVTQLVGEGLPDGVRFSLRVFGHKEADSCRTDLEIPLGPLDRERARAVVASIEPMNLAKTPIARTLAESGATLEEVPGPHLVVLVTDGEETCDGDPGAVIRALVDAGLDVRVNIVGFAIDELMLRETFQSWAEMGNGRYIDAPDADELAAGLAGAVYRTYQVLNESGLVVAGGAVNGPPIELPAGDYTIRLGVAGGEAERLDASVAEDALTVIDLDEP